MAGGGRGRVGWCSPWGRPAVTTPSPPPGGSPGGLPEDLRALVRLSAALASRRRETLEEALFSAIRSAAPVEVEEALLQSYLFLGFPAALGGLARWRSRSGRPPPPPLDEDPGDWGARGEEVCARVYGGQYPDLRENIAGLHPEMDRWMVLEGYGKVLGRPGLELGRRELCIVAILAVLDVPVQLYSHLRGALNVGVAPGWVGEALEEALLLASSDGARARGRETWGRVRARHAHR
jgi:4-carboxymuconolactone decarboxylase